MLFSVLTYNATAYFVFFHEEHSTRGFLTTPAHIQVNSVTQDQGGRKAYGPGTQKPEVSGRYGSAARGEGPMSEAQRSLEEKTALVGNYPGGGGGQTPPPSAPPQLCRQCNRYRTGCHMSVARADERLSQGAARATGTSCTFLLSWVHRLGHTQRQSLGTGPCARAEPCDIQEKKGSFKTSSPVCQICSPPRPHGGPNTPWSAELRGAPHVGHATGPTILRPIIKLSVIRTRGEDQMAMPVRIRAAGSG